MKFPDYSARWRDTILSLKKPATQASMLSHVRKMDKAFNCDLLKITEEEVQRHISQISKTLSPRAVRNYWGTMRLILSRARKEGLIQSVPEPVLPRGGAKPQPFFTLEEMQTLSRLDPLYFLLSETGLRAGEAFGLKNSDIDFKNLTLTVNRSNYNGQDQDPKTENAFRTICISSSLAVVISPLARNDYMFGTRNGTPQRQNYALGKLVSISISHDCGVDDTKRGFHAFRRGNATLCASEEIGMPIKMVSYRHGRATGDLTTDVYVQYTKLADRKYADKLGEMLLK